MHRLERSKRRVTPGNRTRSGFLCLLVCGTLLQARSASASAQPEAATPARIDAVFVLDTTGSMSGLIEGAKQKIWSIASAMSDAKGQPDIRVGLLGYRDRGDEYITRFYDLSSDIDSVYEKLQALRAGGGGDTPESVNQALHEAVGRMSWREDARVYRVIFLVGDAPPHMDYQDDVAYSDSLSLATSRDIIVNTVQCGSHAATTPVWKEIARRGEGHYASIAQDGGMVAMETPFDAPLATLNHQLAETLLPYGASARKRGLLDKIQRAARSDSSVVASRLAYLSKNGSPIASGESDLVDDLHFGRVQLEEIPKAALPESMQELDREQAQVFLQGKVERRNSLQRQISQLVAERESHLELARKRLRAEGLAAGFDEQVLKSIREQASDKGIEFD